MSSIAVVANWVASNGTYTQSIVFNVGDEMKLSTQVTVPSGVTPSTIQAYINGNAASVHTWPSSTGLNYIIDFGPAPNLPGQYAVYTVVTFSNGSQGASNVVQSSIVSTLAVAAPNFKITVSTNFIQMRQYSSQTVTVYATPYYGFNQSVSITASTTNSRLSFTPTTYTSNALPDQLVLKITDSGSQTTSINTTVYDVRLVGSTTSSSQVSEVILKVQILPDNQIDFGFGVYDNYLSIASILTPPNQPKWGNPVNNIVLTRGSSKIITLYLKFYNSKTNDPSIETYPNNISLVASTSSNPGLVVGDYSTHLISGGINIGAGSANDGSGNLIGASFSTTAFPTPAYVSYINPDAPHQALSFHPPSLAFSLDTNSPLGSFTVYITATDTVTKQSHQAVVIVQVVADVGGQTPLDLKEDAGIRHHLVPYND
jgi:hypothetical protein